MTNETNFTAFEQSLGNLGADREVAPIPLKKGQVIKLIDGGEGIGYKYYNWSANGSSGKRGVFLCEGGIELPFKQVARRNNGLGLNGTRNQMLTKFAKKIDGNYSIRIVDTFKQESSFYEGKDVYLIFEEANQEASENAE